MTLLPVSLAVLLFSTVISTVIGRCYPLPRYYQQFLLHVLRFARRVCMLYFTWIELFPRLFRVTRTNSAVY